MKLFARYTRLNLSAMLVAFLLGMIALFFSFRYILIHQVDEGLETERDEIVAYIQQHQKLPPPSSFSDLQIVYQEVNSTFAASFRTVQMVDSDGIEPARQFEFPITFLGKIFQFRINTPLEGTDTLLRIIALVTLGMLLLVLLSIYWVNHRIVRSLLKPFYQTTKALSQYSLAQATPLLLPETSVQEFSMLNETLNAMAARSAKDFEAIRSFTAQAAHEMQTPLAVLSARLEALMQMPELNEATAKQIGGIDQSVAKLTRLFSALLLLTKIENQQFLLSDELSVAELLENKTSELQDLIDGGNISLESVLERIALQTNKHLFEILIGNLLSNAIRYNYSGGTISISLSARNLSIANTSNLPEIPKESLFQQFFRNPDSGKEGNGLGLSIVAQICKALGFRIVYHFKNGVQIFEVWF